MAPMIDTNFRVLGKIDQLAERAGATLFTEQDDLGSVEGFRLRQPTGAYEFVRHPDAPDPDVVSILSNKPHDLKSLSEALMRLEVTPSQVRVAVEGEDRQAADLDRLRNRLNMALARRSLDSVKSRAAEARAHKTNAKSRARATRGAKADSA